MLQEIKTRSIRISIYLLIIIILSMTMSFSIIDFQSIRIPVLYPDPSNNISIQIISFMKTSLLPKNVLLIQTSPGQAFFTQIYISIISSLFFAWPLILKELINFIFPALLHNERKIIKDLLIPAMLLFLAGCAFSYFVVIPYTIEFLYKYGESLGVKSFFEISQFAFFTMNFLLIFGFSYQIPLIMLTLTKLEIVKLNFWKNNLKYVIILLVVFGAFITPDGSGITMWFIVVPLLFLYLIGMIAIKIQLSKENKNSTQLSIS